jgi:hypothetical protein
MIAKMRFWSTLVALCCVFVGPTVGTASAVTIEVAKKCGALTAKAFPPRQIGNPAAGSAKGNGNARQQYYRDCIKNGGNIDDDAGTKRSK